MTSTIPMQANFELVIFLIVFIAAMTTIIFINYSAIQIYKVVQEIL